MAVRDEVFFKGVMGGFRTFRGLGARRLRLMGVAGLAGISSSVTGDSVCPYCQLRIIHSSLGATTSRFRAVFAFLGLVVRDFVTAAVPLVCFGLSASRDLPRGAMPVYSEG